MENNIQVGDAVFFYWNNQIYYRTILKIFMGSDGLMAQFNEGCQCDHKTIALPIDKIYKTKEELKNYIEKEN